jgi:hypothetical protein
VLAACCVVASARSAEPKLWMIGVDIPATAFGAGWQDYRVYSTAFVVLLLAGMLFGGLLGDFFGRRRVLLLGALVSTAATGLAAFSLGVPWFAATGLLALGAGAVAFPLTLAVVRLTFQGRERPMAILIYTAVTSAALLVGLLAIVVDQLVGWRATLVVPGLAGAVGTYLTWRYVPESRARERVLSRAASAAAWALVLLPLTLGFVGARLAGTWANPISGTALVIAGVGLLALALARRGRRRAGTTARLPWRKRHLLSVMLLTAATLSFGLTGYVLQLYGFFNVVQGYGVVVAGLALLPILASVVLTARRAARLTLRLDARRLIAGGLAVMGVAAVLTALLRPGVPYWFLVPPLALFGFGFLVAQTAWTNAFLSAMPDAVVGASAGIVKATATTGSALAGALLGTVLLVVGQADFARRLAGLGLSGLESTLATGALNAVLLTDAAVDVSVPPPDIVGRGLLAVYHEAYTVGVAVALLVAAGVCLLVAALAWVALEPSRLRPAPVAPVAVAPADEVILGEVV